MKAKRKPAGSRRTTSAARLSKVKQRAFVAEYCVDFNGAQAAIRAGYSKKRARQTAYDLLSRDDIAQAIAERVRQRAEASEGRAQAVIDELSKIAFSNMLDYIQIGPDGLPRPNFSTLTRDQGAAIAKLAVDIGRPVVRFELADKKAALEALGRHYGLFKHQVEHGVSEQLQSLFEAVSGTAIRPQE